MQTKIIKIKYTVSLFAGMTIIACSPHYADPYTGNIDSNRTFKQEGLITSLYSLIAIGNEKATAPANSIKNTSNLACAATNNTNHTKLATIKNRIDNALEPFDMSSISSNNRIQIELPTIDKYSIDSPHITSTVYPVYDTLIEILRPHHDLRLEFHGHTDSTGSSIYNQRLSQERADNVERYFNRYNIHAKQTTSVAQGEIQPRTSNASESGRAINRRVSLIICST